MGSTILIVLGSYVFQYFHVYEIGSSRIVSPPKSISMSYAFFTTFNKVYHLKLSHEFEICSTQNLLASSSPYFHYKKSSLLDINYEPRHKEELLLESIKMNED